MAYAPTITPFVTADPCPRVEVLFSSFATGTVAVDVYRLAGGRTFLMRGGVKATVAGALSRIDFEVPFGVPVSYRAEQFDGAGLSLGFTDSGTITLTVAETWVHNPLNPQGSTTVQFMRTAARDIVRPVDGDYAKPLGRSVAVIIGGQRRGVTDVPLDVVVDSIEQADRLQDMLGGYDRRSVPVICFRIGANDRIRLPRPLFAGVLELHETDLNYTIGYGETIQFPMNGTEVDPPTPALLVPLLTRADLNAAYTTRSALNAAYLRRLDADRDYSLAGTAS